jgi:hypothetical protein
MKKIMLSLAAIMSASGVYAQNYAGTISDLNTVFDPPQPPNSTICGHLSSQPDQSEFSACVEGVAAASWMAQKHATKVGEYLGCLDGFYQGISDGYDATSNPNNEQVQTARNTYSKMEFVTAKTRATDRATREGSTASQDDIIRRYRAVIDQRDAQGRQVLPNKSMTIPANTFHGFDDGYEVDILPGQITGSVDDMVGRDAPHEERYIAYRIKAKQAQVAKDLCNVNQTLFLARKGMPSLTLWDFFKAHRQYNFENYGWKNGSWAWDFFTNDERTGEQFATFARIEKKTKKITVMEDITERRVRTDENGQPVVKRDAAGNVVLGTDGKPVFEYDNVVVGTRPVEKVVPLSPEEINNLKNKYRQAFENAYSISYARQYASREYYTSGSRNYATAKIIGQAIGSDVAKYRAERDAYNTGYKVQSAKTYGEVAEKKYVDSFKKLLGVFETNSVYELNSARIEGQVRDDIFRGGEQIAASFDVSNLGEKVNTSSFSLLSSSTVPQRAGFNFSVNSLTSKTFDTPVLASLANNMLAGDTLSLSLGIENQAGALSVADSLNVKKNQNITLRDYAEVASLSPAINVNEGIIEVVANITNAAGIESPSTADISMTSSASTGTVTSALMPLAAKETRQVVLTSRNLDPYSLISNSTVSVTVESKMAGKVISKKTIQFAASNINQRDLINDYFAALATGVTTNSGNEPRQVRLQNLADMIDASVAQEIAGKIKWHKAPVMSSTTVKALADTYLKFVRRNQMNAEGQAEFDELALRLASRVKSVKAKGMFNDRKARKAYLKELNKISPRVPLKP